MDPDLHRCPGRCSITTGERSEVINRTDVYGAHVGGCAHVWGARACNVV